MLPVCGATARTPCSLRILVPVNNNHLNKVYRAMMICGRAAAAHERRRQRAPGKARELPAAARGGGVGAERPGGGARATALQIPQRCAGLGTLPQDIAPLPSGCLQEINIKLPWARPLPGDLLVRSPAAVWFVPSPKPAPLAIVIPGTAVRAIDTLATLRAILYGAGYHVLTFPSPTFPGFIAAASSTEWVTSAGWP